MRKVQLTIKQEEVAPATTSDLVVMSHGKTLKEELSTNVLDKFSREVTVVSSMEKVADGVYDGAYESCVFKGKSLVNLASEKTKSFTTSHFLRCTLSHELVNGKKYLLKWDITNNTIGAFDVRFLRTSDGVRSGAFTLNVPKVVTVTNDGFDAIEFFTNASSISQGLTATIDNIMVVEYVEGMENNISYFEGLCDVKMPILHNIGATTPITDGLLCWYDGRTGKGNETILEDLSGNENHAVLKNFAFDGEDGWQENGIRVRSYGSQSDKNAIQSNNAIANCKSICIYLTKLQDSAPWYIFDGRQASTTYWYSGGYSNNFNPSKCRKNGETFIAPTHGDMLPKIGEPTMLYFELNLNTPLHPTLMARYSNSEQVNGVFHACMIYDRPLTQKEIEFNMCYLNSFKEAIVVNKSEIEKQNKTNILRTSEEIVLREVNGVQDTYNPLTGEYVKRIGEVVITSAVAKSVIVLDENVRVNIAMSTLNGDNGTTKANNTLSDKFYWSEANARDIEGLRVNGNTLHWCISRDKLTSHDLQGVNTWLQSNPITVQYELAEPITTIVEPSTIPFAYENGHVILESGYEGQSLLPELKYSAPASKNGVISTTSKTILKHEQRLHKFEDLLLRESILMDYRLMLTMLDSM